VTPGSYQRLPSQFQRNDRCQLCFGYGRATVGIGSVMMCQLCFSVFDQIFALMSWKSKDRKFAKSFATEEYEKQKLEYLDRLANNVAEYIKSERRSLKKDSADLRKELDQYWELMDAEDKLRKLKRDRGIE